MVNKIIRLIKDHLQRKIGTKIQYEKDCRKLSKQIFTQTNRQLSSSTIKRFFGLVVSPFKTSKYTLDTFAAFLGFEDWIAYINSFDESKCSIPNTNTWDLLKRRALLIPEYSLSSLKQKTSYNPETDLFSSFAGKIFEAFMDAPQTATMFVAPDGYGKSTILILRKKLDPDLIDNVIACSTWIENIENLSLHLFPQFEFSVISNLNLCERFDEVLLLVEHVEAKYDFSPSETSGFYLF